MTTRINVERLHQYPGVNWTYFKVKLHVTKKLRTIIVFSDNMSSRNRFFANIFILIKKNTN